MTRSARDRNLADARSLLHLLLTVRRKASMRDMLLEDVTYTAGVLPEHRADIMMNMGEAMSGGTMTGAMQVGTTKKLFAVDVIIVTVKQPEFDAAKVAFDIGLLEDRDELVGGADCFRREVPRHRDASRNVSFVLTMNAEDSQYTMAAFCSTLARIYSAKYWVLIGMAAGGAGLELGDVVCVSRVIDHNRLVRTPHGDIHNPRSYKIEGSIARQVNTFRPERAQWHDILDSKIAEARSTWPTHLTFPANDLSDYVPKHEVGTSLAGDVLIEDGSLDAMAKDLNVRKNYTGEMEGLGFAAFVSEDRTHRQWLMWRGVADHGSPQRVKDWQFVASLAAATAARLMLTRTLDLSDEDLAF
jgi:hypothetical protein